MGYRKYTDCVTPGNYWDLGFTYLGVMGLVASIVTGLVVAAELGPAGPASLVAIAVLIALVTVLISFLYWWLYGRLICLGGQKCVIGRLKGRPSVMPLSKAGDDDASINLILPPGPPELGQLPLSLYQDSVPQGELVKPQWVIFSVAGRGYVDDEDHFKYISGLHCEFEGSGIRNLLAWAHAVLALLVALLILPYPFNVIILWLLSVITVFAGTTALFDPFNPGSPGDVDPNLGTLTPGDIYFIKGDWVYDSLHNGWNEIHPIRACQRVDVSDIDPATGWPPELSTSASVENLVDEWCGAVQDAEDAEDGGSRDDPVNQWEIHPVVDGCKPPVIIL